MAQNGGFSIRLKTDFAVTRRELERIERVHIPKAKAAAFARAGNAALSAASTELAMVAGVPKWMIRGVGGGAGAKSSGARLRRTNYIPRIDGIILVLLHRHINPAGNVRKENRVTTMARGGGVRVAAVGKAYPNAFHRPGPAGGAVFTRIGTGPGRGLKMETLAMDPWAEKLVRRTAGVVVPRVFAERFEHEMRRRIK
jgi:hypothetical protein